MRNIKLILAIQDLLIEIENQPTLKTTQNFINLQGEYGEDLKKSLFSLKNHNEMWRLHTVLPTNAHTRYNSHFNGYGLGWFLTDMKGNLSVSHTGGAPGMLSIVTMFPT